MSSFLRLSPDVHAESGFPYVTVANGSTQWTRYRVGDVGFERRSHLAGAVVEPGADLVVDPDAADAVGRIWVRGREVVDAEVDNVSGEKAFCRMLAWMQGSFQVVRRSYAGEPSMTGRLDVSVLHRLAYLDEYRRLRAQMPGGSDTLRVASANDLFERRLDPKAELVLGVVETYAHLDKVLENSPFSDLETVRMLFQLAKTGVITAHDESSAAAG